MLDLAYLLYGGAVVGLVTYLAIRILGPRYDEGDSEIQLILHQAMEQKVHVSILVGVLSVIGFALSVVIAGFLATDATAQLEAL